MRFGIYILLLMILGIFQAKAQESIKTLVDEDGLMKKADSVYRDKADELMKDDYVGRLLFMELFKITLDEYKQTEVYTEDKEYLDQLNAFEGLDAKVDSLEQEITEWDNRNKELETQLAELNTQKENLETGIKDVQEQLQQKDAELEQLNEQLANLQTEQERLQLEHDNLTESFKSFGVWKEKIIADYDTHYDNISRSSLSSIDTSSIAAIIQLVDLFDSFPDKETDRIKKQNENLLNLKSIINVYVAGENILTSSANKTAIANAIKNINAASNQAWSQEHKNELRQLSNTLNGYEPYINNFFSVLQLVEDILNNPVNLELAKEGISQSLRKEKSEELNEAIKIKMGLVADTNYPVSYRYLNSLVTELRNSLSQFPNIDVSGLRVKLNN